MLPLSEERRGRRLQVLWVCFVVCGVALPRLGQHFGVEIDLLRLLYAVLVLIATVLGFVLYHRDVTDDLPKTAPCDFSVSPLGARVVLIALAFGLVCAVWWIHREPLTFVLLLPVNAMYMWLWYVRNLTALATRRKRSAQQPART